MASRDDKGSGDPRGQALLAFRAALDEVHRGGRRFAQALIEHPRAAAIVPLLPVQELYYAIRDLGLADAHEVLELASPEQFQGFVDLAAWERADFLPEKAAEWIDALIDLGPDKLGHVVEAMDPEVVALFLQKQAIVYDTTLETPPDEPRGHYYPTPDRFYLIDVLAEGEAGKRIERFLDWLYRADLDLARRVVMSAKWEVTAELEEYAHRWRSGRMADLGFVDFHEALEVYRWLDPTTVHIGENSAGAAAGEPSTLPVLTADIHDDRGFLARSLRAAADGGDADLLGRLHSDLLVLANRVMAADQVEPGDETGARRAIARLVAYLGLALEYLGRGDPQRGAEALRSIALLRLFRVGVSLTLKLKQAADTLAARAFVTLVPGQVSLLDGPDRVAIAALRRRRPTREDGSLFETLAQIAESATRLEEAAQLALTVQQGLGVDPRLLSPEALAGVHPPAVQITFSTIVATLLGNALLDRPPALVPLRPADLRPLRDRAMDGAALRAEVRARLEKLVSDRLAERGFPSPRALPRFRDAWLAHLERTLAPATVGAPAADPRDVTGLLLAIA